MTEYKARHVVLQHLGVVTLLQPAVGYRQGFFFILPRSMTGEHLDMMGVAAAGHGMPEWLQQIWGQSWLPRQRKKKSIGLKKEEWEEGRQGRKGEGIQDEREEINSEKEQRKLRDQSRRTGRNNSEKENATDDVIFKK